MKAKNIALPRSIGLKELLSNDEAYAVQYQAVVLHAESLKAGELNQKYENEYNSWRNRKKYSKDFKIPWFQGMNDFSNFLLVNVLPPTEN